MNNNKRLSISIELYPVINKSKLLNTVEKININFKIFITFKLKKSYSTTLKTSICISKFKREIIPHYPYWKTDTVKKTIRILKRNNIKNMLILKGDTKKDVIYKNYKRKYTNKINIYTAAYPGYHIKCHNYYKNVKNLKEKKNSNGIVTQITIHKNEIIKFIRLCKNLNINLNKIFLGITYFNDLKEIYYIINNTSITIKRSQLIKLNSFIKNKKIICYFNKKTLSLIIKSIKNGIKNIHLYIMNIYKKIKILNLLKKAI